MKKWQIAIASPSCQRVSLHLYLIKRTVTVIILSWLKRIQRLSEREKDRRSFPIIIESQVDDCFEKILRWSRKKEWRALHQISFVDWIRFALQRLFRWQKTDTNKDPEFFEDNTVSSRNFRASTGWESSHTTQIIHEWTVQIRGDFRTKCVLKIMPFCCRRGRQNLRS